MKCLILAGGFAVRLQHLIGEWPKALLEYKGKRLLDHIVEKVPEGIDILVTINAKFEAAFCEWQNGLVKNLEIGVEPCLSNENKLGAVSAIDFWVRHRNISEDLLVICGDNYFDFNLQQFVARYNSKNTLMGVYEIGSKSEARNFGVVEVEGNKLIKLQEKPAMAKSSLIATGIYIFPPRILSYVSQYCSHGRQDQLGGLISYLLGLDEVHVCAFDGLWFDIGSVSTYEQVRPGQGFGPNERS